MQEDTSRTMSKNNYEARLFVEDTLSSRKSLVLKNGQGHYLRAVLRLKSESKVALFNGIEGEWLSTIKTITKKYVELEVIKKIRSQEAASDIWLVFAPIKRTRIDYLAQKATELGVGALWPIFTKFTSVSRVNTERLKSNAIEASEQSGRLTVPEILVPIDFRTLMIEWPKDRVLFCLDETGGGMPILDAFRSSDFRAAGLLIGPEGGFANEELDQVDKLGNVCRVSLGNQILRSDTAAVAALACWQAVAGDWR